MCSSGYLTLAHGFNGNVYVDTTPEDNDVNDPVYKFSEKDGYIIGDEEGRLFHMYDKTMSDIGVSRMRMSTQQRRMGGTTEL